LTSRAAGRLTAPGFRLVWTASFPNDHLPFALSSPVVAQLPGGPAAVVGDRSGHVFAVYLTPRANGASIVAWAVTTRGPHGPVGVDSSPSTRDGIVFFGIGWAGERGVGGYEAINPNGSRRWFRLAVNPVTDPTRDAGVAAGLTVGILQSQVAVVGPSLGQRTYVLNASSGALLRGFPWFQADTEYSTAAIADVEGQGWATDMVALLSDTWQRVLDVKESGLFSLPEEELVSIRAVYVTIIAAGHVANPPPPPSGRRGRTRKTKAANLLARLDNYADDVLRFATDFEVSFDNNEAERQVRMVKVQQKISGGFRTKAGATAWLAVRSYLATVMKNGVNPLGALQRLMVGDPWMPPAPDSS